jgi:hypothetical protein
MKSGEPMMGKGSLFNAPGSLDMVAPCVSRFLSKTCSSPITGWAYSY